MKTTPNNDTDSRLAAQIELARRQMVDIIPTAVKTVGDAIANGDAKLAKQLISEMQGGLISVHPVAHFLAEHGRGDIVLKALEVVKREQLRKRRVRKKRKVSAK